MAFSALPPPDEDLVEDDAPDDGARGALTNEERLEAERFANEAHAEMRRGMPWWLAWATANEPLPDDFGPEDPPVVIKGPAATWKDDALRAIFAGGPTRVPVDVRPVTLDVDRFYPKAPEPEPQTTWERAEAAKREADARLRSPRGRPRRRLILAEGDRAPAQGANGLRPAGCYPAPAPRPPGGVHRRPPAAAAEGPKTSEERLHPLAGGGSEEPALSPQPAALAATPRSTAMMVKRGARVAEVLEALKSGPKLARDIAETPALIATIQRTLSSLSKKGAVQRADGGGYQLTKKGPKSVEELAEKRAAGEALNRAVKSPCVAREGRKAPASRAKAAKPLRRPEPVSVADAVVEIPAAPCRAGEHGVTIDALLEKRLQLVSAVTAKVAAIDGAIRACIE